MAFICNPKVGYRVFLSLFGTSRSKTSTETGGVGGEGCAMRETVNFRGVIQIENKTRRNDQFSFFFLAGGARGHREGSVGTVKHWCLYWEDKIN